MPEPTTVLAYRTLLYSKRGDERIVIGCFRADERRGGDVLDAAKLEPSAGHIEDVVDARAFVRDAVHAPARGSRSEGVDPGVAKLRADPLILRCIRRRVEVPNQQLWSRRRSRCGPRNELVQLTQTVGLSVRPRCEMGNDDRDIPSSAQRRHQPETSVPEFRCRRCRQRFMREEAAAFRFRTIATARILTIAVRREPLLRTQTG